MKGVITMNAKEKIDDINRATKAGFTEYMSLRRAIIVPKVLFIATTVMYL
jgi:hypothetical protein